LLSGKPVSVLGPPKKLTPRERECVFDTGTTQIAPAPTQFLNLLRLALKALRRRIRRWQAQIKSSSRKVAHIFSHLVSDILGHECDQFPGAGEVRCGRPQSTVSLGAEAQSSTLHKLESYFLRASFPSRGWLHKASKTLILADTIINIELDKVTEPWRTATKFTGMYHPYGQVFFGMRLPLLLQRQKAEAAIRKIYSWQPQHILLSHGRCFDADADKVIRRIFGEPPR
jgi:hypothetical protein